MFNPVNWVREKLAPGEKGPEDEEKVKAAKEQAKREGTANVFEDLVSAESSPADQGKMVRGGGKKHKLVR